MHVSLSSHGFMQVVIPVHDDPLRDKDTTSKRGGERVDRQNGSSQTIPRLVYLTDRVL